MSTQRFTLLRELYQETFKNDMDDLKRVIDTLKDKDTKAMGEIDFFNLTLMTCTLNDSWASFEDALVGKSPSSAEVLVQLGASHSESNLPLQQRTQQPSLFFTTIWL